MRANTSELVQRLAGLLGDAPATYEKAGYQNATHWSTPRGAITARAPFPRGPSFSYLGEAPLNATPWQMGRLLRGMGVLAPEDAFDAGPERSGVTSIVVRGTIADTQILGEQSEIHSDYGGEGVTAFLLGQAWRDASRGALLDEAFAVPIAQAFDDCARAAMGHAHTSQARRGESRSDVVDRSIVYVVTIDQDPRLSGCEDPVHDVVVDAVSGRVHGYWGNDCVQDPSVLPWLPAEPSAARG